MLIFIDEGTIRGIWDDSRTNYELKLRKYEFLYRCRNTDCWLVIRHKRHYWLMVNLFILRTLTFCNWNCKRTTRNKFFLTKMLWLLCLSQTLIPNNGFTTNCNSCTTKWSEASLLWASVHFSPPVPAFPNFFCQDSNVPRLCSGISFSLWPLLTSLFEETYSLYTMHRCRQVIF